MEGNSTVLGIAPPATVRIIDGGRSEDWPAAMVQIAPDAIKIVDPLTGRTLVTHDYRDAQAERDGCWTFEGPPPWREDFYVCPGPPQPPSMDTDGPMYDDDPWP